MGNCLPNPATSFSSATNHRIESVNSPPQEEVDVDSEVEPVEEIVSPNLKMYTLAELQSATRNFSHQENLHERGGFEVGGVYKGWVDETTLAPSSKLGVGIPVAVKKHLDSDQSLKDWKVKSDVYNFGIVLLEILTGRRVIDRSRPRDEQNLVEWASPYLHKKGTLKRIMDPRLENRYPIKAAYKAAALVLKCLVHSPKDRPSMNEVLNTLEHIKTIRMSL